MRRSLSLAAAFSVAGCIGPLVTEFNMEPVLAERLRQEIRTVTNAQLAATNHQPLGPVTATSCFNNLITDTSASQDDAMDQLRYRVSLLNGNALLNPVCRSEGTSLIKNCWSSVTCNGGAVRIGSN